MNSYSKPKKERQYYIDWIRILLILSVFVFHIGMVFNPWDWHVKNNTQYEELAGIMRFLHYWRMPLLFMISGVGTYFALGFRSNKQYIGERFKRLMIPFIAGVFILVPIQVYFDTNFIERMSAYENLFEFYPHMFEGIYPKGNFSWHHLWFILYLFIISMVITPLLKLTRDKSFLLISNKLEQVSKKSLGLNIFFIPLLVSELVLRPYFPNSLPDLINDWASISYFMIYFISGFILLSNKNIPINIEINKRNYLLQAIGFTVLLFSLKGNLPSNYLGTITWEILEIGVAWSTGIAVIGYGKKYLNFNNRLRKVANEAIYPFYLLHQPIIVVLGYYIVQLEISSFNKFALLTTSSLILIIIIYWYFIRRFNITRILFGMKPIKKEVIHSINMKNIVNVKS